MNRSAKYIEGRTAARRGRPAARLFSPADVAELVSHTPERVIKALEFDRREVAAGRRPSFFSHAWQDRSAVSAEDAGWRIPESDVRALVGPELPQLFTVADFARLIGFKVKRLHEYISRGAIKPWDPARPALGGWRKVFGKLRISAATYWELPGELPSCVPARPPFFSRGRGNSKGPGSRRKEAA